MRFCLQHVSTPVSETDVFDPEYARNNFALASLSQLSSLAGSRLVGTEHVEITVSADSYGAIVDEYPDNALPLTAKMALFKDKDFFVTPLAVLVRNVESSFPVTLEWKFTGCDVSFTQKPKTAEGYVYKWIRGKPKWLAIEDRYFNLNTKFTEYAAGKNKAEFIGFDACSCRKMLNGSIVKDAEEELYTLDVNYKYFNPLWCAFRMIHKNHPGLHPILLHDGKLWKVNKSLLDDVIDWVESDCVTDREQLCSDSDSFTAYVSKYDGKSWHVIQGEYDSSCAVSATVSVIFVYKYHMTHQ